MGKIATALVLLDGRRIGTITCGDESDVSPYPLGEGNLGAVAPSPSVSPKLASREFPAPYYGNEGVGRPGAFHGPLHSTHEKHGPTFRPGITPRGSAEPAKPDHFTTGDVAKSVAGHDILEGKHFKTGDVQSAVQGGVGGAVDRRRIAEELAGNEALQRRYAQMVVGEIYYDRASDKAKLVQAETAANRALIRGHSLERALWGKREHGSSGYYPPSTFDRGMTEAQFQDFKTNILPKVLAGSDEAKGFTGNASANVAANQIAKGTPHFDLRSEGGDQYFREGPFTNPLPRLPSRPQGVESLPRNLPQGVTRLAPSEPQAGSEGGDLSDVTPRGSANLFSSGRANAAGIPGGVGQNLTQIKTESGKPVIVNREAAPHFKAFLDELEASGYKIDDIGGYAHRNKRGGGGWSEHAYGNAIDINPDKNPFHSNKTDLPANISAMAAKHGLSWGGDWKGAKDNMHFEYTGAKLKPPETKTVSGTAL